MNLSSPVERHSSPLRRGKYMLPILALLLEGCVTTHTVERVTILRAVVNPETSSVRIKRVAVFPVKHKLVTPEDASDFAASLALAIHRRDSSVAAFAVVRPDSVPDSVFLAGIAESLGVDAVILPRVVAAKGRKTPAEPKLSGRYKAWDGSTPAMGTGGMRGASTPLGGAGGRASVTLEFEMLDPKTGAVLWEFTCESVIKQPRLKLPPTVFDAINLAKYEVYSHLPF